MSGGSSGGDGVWVGIVVVVMVWGEVVVCGGITHS